jgi:hypothetical protein
MLIDQPDGSQVYIPDEHIELDVATDRWHKRNLSRGVAVTVFILAVLFLLGKATA